MYVKITYVNLRLLDLRLTQNKHKRPKIADIKITICVSQYYEMECVLS